MLVARPINPVDTVVIKDSLWCGRYIEDVPAIVFFLLQQMIMFINLDCRLSAYFLKSVVDCNWKRVLFRIIETDLEIGF